MIAAATPGWFGKLPSLGDFASRRVDVDFMEAWDGWLAQGIAGWQARDGDAWLTDYLNGPSWRFVLMPGTLPGECGAHAWAGAITPSVDRVGRYFPLTLVQRLDALPEGAEQGASLLAWLLQLDDLAVDAMLEEWPVDQLETELARLSPPTISGIPIASPIAALLGDLSSRTESWRGRTFWITHGAEADLLHISVGLPKGAALPALLSGTPEFTSPMEQP